MQEKQRAFAERFGGFAPMPYRDLPDLGLYMDQVITYVQRQCASLYPAGEHVLTPATVNNYVKCQLVSRPDGKKYGRDQLAQLLMLCILKQAATIDEMRTLLRVPEGGSVEAMYGAFCDTQRSVFAQIADAVPRNDPMTCCVQSAAYRFLCSEMLTEIQKEAAEEAEQARQLEETARKVDEAARREAERLKKDQDEAARREKADNAKPKKSADGKGKKESGDEGESFPSLMA